MILLAAIDDPRRAQRVLSLLAEPLTITTTGHVVEDDEPTVIRAPTRGELRAATLTLDEAIERALTEDA